MNKIVSNLHLLSSRISSKLFRFNVANEVIVPNSSNSSPKVSHYKLILYDFEASPWCRLVREQCTILDLNIHMRPCPKEDLFIQGSYTNQSRFRHDAMNKLKTNVSSFDHHQQKEDDDNDDDSSSSEALQQQSQQPSLRFPILVDETNPNNHIVIKESYDIIEYLWKHYGPVLSSSSEEKEEGSVAIPTKSKRRRPDQIVNSSKLPFIIRFILLSGPSYVRCLVTPYCGLFRAPMKEATQNFNFTLYQSEGCPSSRLVREVLCTLEIPYHSISCANGSSTSVPTGTTNTSHRMTKTTTTTAGTIPTLVVEQISNNSNNNEEEEKGEGVLHHKYCENDNDKNDTTTETNEKLLYLVGHDEINSYLWEQFWDNDDSIEQPSLIFHKRMNIKDNIGQNDDLYYSAYTAFLKGQRSFVPPIVEK